MEDNQCELLTNSWIADNLGCNNEYILHIHKNVRKEIYRLLINAISSKTIHRLL